MRETDRGFNIYFYSMHVVQLIVYYIMRKKMNFNKMHCWPWRLKHQSKFCLLQFRPRTAIKKIRQIDARVRLDAKWLENRREFAEIGTGHPLAELKICSWSSSFFVGSCLFLAWLLHKIRLLDPHLYRNTLSLLLNTLVGLTPEILLKFVHHIAVNIALNLL